MKRTTVHLTDQQLAALRTIAKVSGLTIAEEIRRAIDAYTARRPSKGTK